jgi:hypothetical protein
LLNALKKRDKRFFGFRYFPYYGLAFMGDDYLSAALRGFFNKPGKYDLDYFKGSTPIRDVKWKYKSYLACDEAIMYNKIDSIASICKMHNSNLILVLSPIYSKASEKILNRIALLQKLKLKATSNNVALFDYSTDEICNDSTFFADPYHMNEKGAKLFTEKFAKDLKSIFKR